jgi:hypothetical protein
MIADHQTTDSTTPITLKTDGQYKLIGAQYAG